MGCWRCVACTCMLLLEVCCMYMHGLGACVSGLFAPPAGLCYPPHRPLLRHPQASFTLLAGLFTLQTGLCYVQPHTLRHIPETLNRKPFAAGATGGQPDIS